MEQFIENISHYLVQMGSFGLMLGIFIDGLGVPFPGGLMLMMSGLLVQRGQLTFLEVLLAVFVGHLSGGTVAYIIGRRVGLPFVEKYGHYLRINTDRLTKGRQWLKKSAAIYIIFGRFIPTLGNVTPYIAGLSNLKYIPFFVYSSIFALLWGSLNLGIGYIFGHSWRQVSKNFGSNMWLIALLVILLYGAYWYYNRRKRLKG